MRLRILTVITWWISTIIKESLVYLTKDGFIAVCISSSVCPLVSGTSFATNRTVKPDMLANMKNVPDQKWSEKFTLGNSQGERKRWRGRKRPHLLSSIPLRSWKHRTQSKNSTSLPKTQGFQLNLSCLLEISDIEIHY